MGKNSLSDKNSTIEHTGINKVCQEIADIITYVLNLCTFCDMSIVSCLSKCC